MAKEQERAQYALVDKNGEIQAIILTRGSEFYCFERLEDSPGNLKEAQELYPDCEVIGRNRSNNHTAMID